MLDSSWTYCMRKTECGFMRKSMGKTVLASWRDAGHSKLLCRDIVYAKTLTVSEYLMIRQFDPRLDEPKTLEDLINRNFCDYFVKAWGMEEIPTAESRGKHIVSRQTTATLFLVWQHSRCHVPCKKVMSCASPFRCEDRREKTKWKRSDLTIGGNAALWTWRCVDIDSLMNGRVQNRRNWQFWLQTYALRRRAANEPHNRSTRD